MKAPLPGRVRHIALRLLLVGAVCLAVGSIAWLVLYSPKSPFPESPLPSPNGHDDFVAAGQSLTGRDFDSTDYIDRWHNELYSTQGLAVLLRTEAKVFEADQRTDDALKSDLDALRFSQESVRGGLLLDMLVGVNCEAIALGSLERVLAALDPPQCRRAIQVIQELDRVREPTAEILARERAWSRRVMGWRGAILRIMPGQAQSLRQAEQKAASKRDQADRQRGAVLIKLACRAYRLESRKAPDRWEDLVPGHLERIPTDPGNGQPLPLDLGTAE